MLNSLPTVPNDAKIIENPDELLTAFLDVDASQSFSGCRLKIWGELPERVTFGGATGESYGELTADEDLYLLWFDGSPWLVIGNYGIGQFDAMRSSILAQRVREAAEKEAKAKAEIAEARQILAKYGVGLVDGE